MADESDRSERRRERRVHALHLLAVTPRASGAPGTPVYTGRTLDVSDVGARIETTVPLVLGQDVELEIGVEEEIISVRGQAVHTEMLSDGLYGAGIRFTSKPESVQADPSSESD